MLLRIVMYKNCFIEGLFGIRKEDVIGTGYKWSLKLGTTDKMNAIIKTLKYTSESVILSINKQKYVTNMATLSMQKQKVYLQDFNG